jgi:hypothetical protein
LRSVLDFLDEDPRIEAVRFVCFSDEHRAIFARTLERLARTS